MNSNLKKIINYFSEDESDFLYSALQIDNHNTQSRSALRFWYSHARENINKIQGNIFEFGVFKGKSLISMALLLKKLNSKKIIYGFDSFEGFPSYSEFDDLKNFNNPIFDNKVRDNFEKLKYLRSLMENKNIDVSNISSSQDFSNNSFKKLENKIKILGLDNIKLISGDFETTVPNFFKSYNDKIFSVNLDCDLYEGYKITLPYIWKYLSKNGYVHLDEYYSLKFAGARIACDDFCKKNNIYPKKQLDLPDSEFERWYLQK